MVLKENRYAKLELLKKILECGKFCAYKLISEYLGTTFTGCKHMNISIRGAEDAPLKQ
jgi:hypothetical protein